MTSTSTMLRRVGIAFLAGLTGLTMLVYALERTSLVNFAATLEGAEAQTPVRVYVTMFVGLALLNLSTFYALGQWAAYLREHPDASQMPVWALLALIVLPGAALVTSVATHAGYIRGLDEVPLDPNMGFVGFQVVLGAMVIIALVLLAARWSPGFRQPRPQPAVD